MKCLKRIIVFAAFSVVFAIIIMIFHELGHAIVAIICGTEITAFAFDHVDWGNAPFTEKQLAWLFINGTLMPIIISVPFFWFPRKTDMFFTGVVSFGVIIGGWIELYAWTVESFFLHEISDVTWFLMFSGLEISIIRIISVIVYLIYTAVACWRCATILSNYISKV